MNSDRTDTVVRWDRDGDGIVTLTLDDPNSAVNTMTSAYRRSMQRMVERLEDERDAVTGVIVTSGKSTFFAGGNLDDLLLAGPADRARLAENVTAIKAQLRRLERLGRPVVAAVNGTALGGGLEIALACHYRVLLDAPGVRVGFPEVTLGLLPGGGGVVRSVRMLGLTAALPELLLQGKRYRPEQAQAIGLVDELATDPADLLARARAWVGRQSQSVQRFDTPGYRIPGGTPASPAVAGMLPALPAMLVKQLRGASLPAPHHILCAAVEGLYVDVDTAFEIETRYFVDLACGQTATNMIQALWFDLNHINAGGSRPGVGAVPAPTRAAVLGAGMMGAGIAHVLAGAGLDVVLRDVDLAAAERGRRHTQDLLDAAVAAGRTTPDRRDAVLGRITPTGDAADVAGCDLVVEAVFEDAALKRRVFAEVEPFLAPDPLLCSNTSTLPITGLATGVSRPDAFVGLHFFSPVEKMPLVEIIVGRATSDAALARAYDLVRRLGKTPIVVGDRRGFFTSRVFATLVLEGAALLADGLAPMSIERAALQAGFPAGPLTLMDEVSLTLMVHIADAERPADEPVAANDPRTHPGTAVVRTMTAHGRGGKAAGGGFFDWADGKRLWPGLTELFPTVAADNITAVPFADAAERMLFAMALESVRCLAEGVLRSVEDGNVGSILGIGFPPACGGTLQFVDQYPGGVAGFTARATELADRYGNRFRPPAILRAANGATLRQLWADQTAAAV